ncbi:MAG: hypothetical protein ACI4VF_06845, partial [Lachnospirales bacterium]
MIEILIVALIVINVIGIILVLMSKPKDFSDTLERKNKELEKEIKSLNSYVGERIDDFSKNIGEKQELMRKAILANISQQEERLKTFSLENMKQLEQIRVTVKDSLSDIQNDNNKKLDEMRGIVDEKLQKTLESKMNESFKQVSERLEQVYKGLGEMNNLARG